jgi:hypothetical protein
MVAQVISVATINIVLVFLLLMQLSNRFFSGNIIERLRYLFQPVSVQLVSAPINFVWPALEQKYNNTWSAFHAF